MVALCLIIGVVGQIDPGQVVVKRPSAVTVEGQFDADYPYSIAVAGPSANSVPGSQKLCGGCAGGFVEDCPYTGASFAPFRELTGAELWEIFEYSGFYTPSGCVSVDLTGFPDDPYELDPGTPCLTCTRWVRGGNRLLSVDAACIGSCSCGSFYGGSCASNGVTLIGSVGWEGMPYGARLFCPGDCQDVDDTNCDGLDSRLPGVDRAAWQSLGGPWWLAVECHTDDSLVDAGVTTAYLLRNGGFTIVEDPNFVCGAGSHPGRFNSGVDSVLCDGTDWGGWSGGGSALGYVLKAEITFSVLDSETLSGIEYLAKKYDEAAELGIGDGEAFTEWGAFEPPDEVEFDPFVDPGLPAEADMTQGLSIAGRIVESATISDPSGAGTRALSSVDDMMAIHTHLTGPLRLGNTSTAPTITIPLAGIGAIGGYSLSNFTVDFSLFRSSFMDSSAWLVLRTILTFLCVWRFAWASVWALMWAFAFVPTPLVCRTCGEVH